MMVETPKQHLKKKKALHIFKKSRYMKYSGTISKVNISNLSSPTFNVIIKKSSDHRPSG